MSPATPITSFDSNYRFLSNFFWDGACILDGVPYRTVEHAFQAAKTLDPEKRKVIASAKTPGAAKRLGRQVPLRPDWEEVKLVVMEDLLRQKFQRPDLRRALLKTGEAELIEGNYWGDTFWGECPLGTGQNHLGKLLMKIRDELTSNQQEK